MCTYLVLVIVLRQHGEDLLLADTSTVHDTRDLHTLMEHSDNEIVNTLDAVIHD